MLTSELINKLRDQLATNGDLEVVVGFDLSPYGGALETLSVQNAPYSWDAKTEKFQGPARKVLNIDINHSSASVSVHGDE